MRKTWIASLLLLCAGVPVLASADDNQPGPDSYSYSTLQVDHLGVHSDYFADRSTGNGLRFSWDTQDMVYVFGQWDKLDFETLPGSSPGSHGSHTLAGIGVGAHTGYSADTSFYIDLAFLQDKLDSSLGGAADDYWRISYGFRSRMTQLLELDGAISTERSTTFGARPFGIRLGVGLDFDPVSLQGSVERTADGNRAMISLVWAYK